MWVEIGALPQAEKPAATYLIGNSTSCNPNSEIVKLGQEVQSERSSLWVCYPAPGYIHCGP